MTRVQGGDHSAQTPIQQQAFALRGWIDASIRQPQTKEEVTLVKESIRRVVLRLLEQDDGRRLRVTELGRLVYLRKRSVKQICLLRPHVCEPTADAPLNVIFESGVARLDRRVEGTESNPASTADWGHSAGKRTHCFIHPN